MGSSFDDWMKENFTEEEIAEIERQAQEAIRKIREESERREKSLIEKFASKLSNNKAYMFMKLQRDLRKCL